MRLLSELDVLAERFERRGDTRTAQLVDRVRTRLASAAVEAAPPVPEHEMLGPKMGDHLSPGAILRWEDGRTAFIVGFDGQKYQLSDGQSLSDQEIDAQMQAHAIEILSPEAQDVADEMSDVAEEAEARGLGVEARLLDIATEMFLVDAPSRSAALEAAPGEGSKFQSFKSKNPAASAPGSMSSAQLLNAVYKKFKTVGDGAIRGGKHSVMDASDGYASYVLEDLAPGDLWALARFKQIVAGVRAGDFEGLNVERDQEPAPVTELGNLPSPYKALVEKAAPGASYYAWELEDGRWCAQFKRLSPKVRNSILQAMQLAGYDCGSGNVSGQTTELYFGKYVEPEEKVADGAPEDSEAPRTAGSVNRGSRWRERGGNGDVWVVKGEKNGSVTLQKHKGVGGMEMPVGMLFAHWEQVG